MTHLLALTLGLLGASTAGVVSAQPITTGVALPGAGRTLLAQPVGAPATVAVTGGYGFTGPVLGQQDRHHRLLTRVALAVHPVEALSAGLYMAGRYDEHRGDAGSDDSIVGDIGLFVFGRLLHVGALRLALGADVWIPPTDGVGFTARAISPSATAYAQIDLGSVALLGRVGYLHDRSRATVDTDVVFEPGDQVSLGVTTADALLIGIGATGHVGELWLYGEVALDLLVRRRGVPLGASRSSATVGAQLALATRYRLGAELGFQLGPQPTVRETRYFRVEPRVSAMVTFAVHLGALRGDTDPPRSERPAVTVAVRGSARDERGDAAVGAQVRAESVDEPSSVVAEATTAPDGSFVLEGLPPGTYDVVVAMPGRHEVRTRQEIDGDVVLADMRVGTYARTLRGRIEAQAAPGHPVVITVRSGESEVTRMTVAEGAEFALEGLPPGALEVVVEGEGLVTRRTTIPEGQSGEIDVITLQPALPDGEIRGTVVSVGGDPIQARIYVEPIEQELVADAEGRFTIITEPGEHIVRIEADGFQTQQRRVVIEERGVVVLEVHLRPAR